MSEGSITTWIEKLLDGDPVAGQHLWERYLDKLIRRAQRRLSGSPKKLADEEDVVVVAFEKFLRMADESRFPRIRDRSDLWQILVLLTDQVAVDQIRFNAAKKRGGGRVRGESALRASPGQGSSMDGMGQIVSQEPTPEFAALAAEQYRRLLDALQKDDLREIAIAKMHGSSNEEIATVLGLSVRSIERKLQLIRAVWTREGAE